jgi:hypothetical protein
MATERFELREMTVLGSAQIATVEFLLGDGPDVAQSNQWIEGKVAVELLAMKSVRLLRIAVLRKAIDLIHEETARLEGLYAEAQRVQR